MAARAVLSGVAASTPKNADGEAEMVRMLKMAKDSAVKTRTQALNQIKAILVTAPAQLREALAWLTVGKLLEHCASFEPGELTTPTAVAQHTLRLLARRNLQLRAEVKALQADIARLATRAAPALLDVFGIGPDGAATMMVTAGDNPQRLRSEAAFAALWLQPDPCLVWQDQPASTQPRRRPPGQRHPAPHRRRSLALARTNPEIHGPPPGRRQEQGRDHALPQALHRPRDLPGPVPNTAPRQRGKGFFPDRLTSIGASTRTPSRTSAR
jgi:hypothetical protein